MVGDAGDDVGEVGLGIERVHPRRLDDGVDGRRPLATGVAAGEEKKPPAMLLAGAPEYSCKYGNHYMSSGTLNSDLNCTREGLRGQVLVGVDGSYTAETIELNQSLSTALSGTGDVRISAKITGRRTGECTAAATTKVG